MSWGSAFCALALLSIATGASAADLKEGLTLSHFAKAVYNAKFQELQEWTCEYCSTEYTKGFRGVKVIKLDDMMHNQMAVMGYSSSLKAIVIAIRGTIPGSLTNWMTNLHFSMTDCSRVADVCSKVTGGKVHQGFRNAYKDFRTDLMHEFTVLRKGHPDAKVLITGHSLGGALATLMAMDIKVNTGVGNANVVTFGSPRVGNQAFADAFAKEFPNSIRVVLKADIVPHVCAYKLGYRAVPTEYWLTDQRAVMCAGGEDSGCSRSLAVTKLTSSDHGMTKYADYLAAKMTATKTGAPGSKVQPRAKATPPTGKRKAPAKPALTRSKSAGSVAQKKPKLVKKNSAAYDMEGYEYTDSENLDLSEEDWDSIGYFSEAE